MQGAAQAGAGTVVGHWRYPVKSMMGEELNGAVLTERGVLGDRRFALVDAATGKVAGAKNPRKWGDFFAFRAAYAEPPRAGAALPAVRLTLPDGAVATSDQPDLAQVLSRALGRDVELAESQGNGAAAAAQAEEYWPDIDGLDFRDTVTDFELPAGTFFDLAVVHLVTTATLDRLRALYPDGRFEARRFRPNVVVATDPEACVLIEIHRKGEVTSWEYMVLPMTIYELNAKLDGKTVWTKPDAHVFGNPTAPHYISLYQHDPGEKPFRAFLPAK